MVSTVAVLTLVGGAGARVVRETLPLRLALLAVSVGVLLLTRTRSALALVVLGLVLLAWFHGRRRLAAAVVLVGAAGLAFLLSGAGRGLTEVLAGGSSRFSAASFGGRFPLWADALRVVEDRPLVGYGYFAGHRFGEYAERFTVTTGRSDPYVDGTWVETALDLGLLGVVALAAFVLWSARAAWRSDGPRALHRTLLVVLLLYSVQDFTVQQPGFPMFLLGGLLLAGRGRQATANTAARPPMNARA
jgi:O-antigen ligase